jgi:hypothetical protein
MEGKGTYYLNRAIASIPEGYEIVVSLDGSFQPFTESKVKVVHSFKPMGAASNLNNAINCANGDIIKILFQDDELTDCDLTKFETITHWGFCKSKHNNERPNHIPYHPESIRELAMGNNTYGSPSAMAFRKTDLRFDENLKFLFDCDFYARMTMKYGQPDFVDTFVNITEWDGMATNTICTGQVRLIDAEYQSYKYGKSGQYANVQ